jgi:cyclopropane-fatty-acyl-phospholipid synthase
MTKLKPFYEKVQAIYDDDHSTEFLSLFLDPTMLYSCAYFERDDMTLHEAQIAKLDLALDKCDLRPGQRLLEVGSGWGAGTIRAAEKYKVNVTALTLSKSQQVYVHNKILQLPPGSGSAEVRLQGWEECDEPVDRIVSIAAFEHFRIERYPAFFQRCRKILPDDGCMLLHTIVWYNIHTLARMGLPVELEGVMFAKFIKEEVFPGGQLAEPDTICQVAEEAGFAVTRRHALGQHYARTLDIWAANLQANKAEALAMTSQEVYDRYMHYLTGCAKYFRSGHINVFQFSLKCR